jgi:hypothetical protein
MTDRFNAALEPFWLFLHKGMIVRRAVLLIAIWMTMDSYAWAKIYAYDSSPDPLIYAALLGVPSALLVTALKFYNDGRQGADK